MSLEDFGDEVPRRMIASCSSGNRVVEDRIRLTVLPDFFLFRILTQSREDTEMQRRDHSFATSRLCVKVLLNAGEELILQSVIVLEVAPQNLRLGCSSVVFDAPRNHAVM